MSQLIIGVSDCQVSNNPNHVLITYALGSCISVTFYDPVSRVAGMLHFMLPESSIDHLKSKQNPYMFADTGVPLLCRLCVDHGAVKRRLVVRIAGGSQILDPDGHFNIGKRNHLAARKLLWKEGLFVHGEDVGGALSRTVRLEVSSGRMWIRAAGGEEYELTARWPSEKGA